MKRKEEIFFPLEKEKNEIPNPTTLSLSLSLKFSPITLFPPSFNKEKTYTYTYILIHSTPISTQKEFPQCLYRTKPTKILGKIASNLQCSMKHCKQATTHGQVYSTSRANMPLMLK
jgi:hypothetical protein